MQRWKERPWLDDERAACDLLNPTRDAKAVQVAGGERLENQQVERALKERGTA